MGNRPCGGPPAFQTTLFNDEDEHWIKEFSGAVIDSASNGGMRVSLTPGELNAYGYKTTKLEYGLTESWTAVEVLDGGSGLAVPMFRVFSTVGNGYVEAFREGSSITITSNGGGGPPIAVPFDPVQNIWWRFSESNGLVHFETSPNGVAWFAHMSVTTATVFPNSGAEHVKISIGARGPAGQTGDGSSVVLANFNGANPSGHAYCLASSFFNNLTSFSPDFVDESNNCTPTFADSHLRVGIQPGQVGTCRVRTTRGFRLKDSVMVAHLEDNSEIGVVASMILRDFHGYGVSVERQPGLFNARYVTPDASPILAQTANQEGSKWMLLSEFDGVVTWAISDTGTSWETLHTGPTGLSSEEVWLEFVVAHAAQSSGTVSFSMINQSPH